MNFFANRRWVQRIWRVAFHETLIGASSVLFVILLLVALVWAAVKGWPALGDVQVEFWGLIFDVFVILVGFGIIQYGKQRRDDIARHAEVIEDLKRWSSEEAKHRVLGAMRRLNRLGKTNFDLSGAHLKNANFTGYGIKSIAGSTLSNGSLWVSDELTASSFEEVDFSFLDASEVVFEKTAPFRFGQESLLHGPRATYTDCNFRWADLRKATFDGAELAWTNAPPDSLEEQIDEEPDGQPVYGRAEMSVFEEANLADASFRYCSFKQADFRLALNIEDADFLGAEGLDTCVFDNDGLKKKIIQNSKRQDPR
ncbi:Pentapeptide repeats (8 copies) [Phaeobacter inhibens]|uniref:pentapeptide repeat-containing protein n=1 Tax=Phaeobacter inhibens TaxID=221822 RepID=UPI000C9CF3F4|nr:pentapeptide repeat-containing protein [Phaeobacter inhibens]AUQ57419.1 Pentapeptide repeats (8 copies) [Phaeobacter inhibens]